MPVLVRRQTCSELSMALRTRQAELRAAPVRRDNAGAEQASRCLPEVAAAGWHLARNMDHHDAMLTDFAGAYLSTLVSWIHRAVLDFPANPGW